MPDKLFRGEIMKLLEAVAANKARQTRAREMNTRAGENLFKVYSGAELLEFALQKLAGARRVAEIASPEALLLPGLDQVEIARVERENPLQIEFCDQSFKVDYSSGSQPRVSLGSEITPDGIWRKLPDDGVLLPGGRQVLVSLGYYPSVCDADIPRLKEKVRNHLNRRQWDEWTSRPEIILPNPTIEGSEVAPIAEAVYGTCVVTNQPLLAFGIASPKYRYYETDPYFEGRWFQNRAEAEAERVKLAEKLAALRQELVERKALAEARLEAGQAKERVQSAYQVCQSQGKDNSLRNALYEHAYGYLPDGLESLRQWTIETNALVEKALAEITEVKEAMRKREEEIAPLVEHIGSDKTVFVHEFAEELVNLVGAANAHQYLTREYTAGYGRARRQSALTHVCTGEKGQRFLALHQASAVDAVLKGVIFWLEHKYKLQPIVSLSQREASNRRQPTPSASEPGSVVLNPGAWDALDKLKL